MSYICTYHTLRLDENLRPRGKTISILNTFTSLNSKQGWVGNCSWRWWCEKRSRLCVFSTSSPMESKQGPGRNPLLRGNINGERCSEDQYIVSGEHSLHCSIDLRALVMRHLQKQTCFCFWIFIKKSVHAPYTHFNINGKPSQWHTENH